MTTHDTQAAWPGEPFDPRFAELDHFINWDSPQCLFCHVTFRTAEFRLHLGRCRAQLQPTLLQVRQRARREAYLAEKR